MKTLLKILLLLIIFSCEIDNSEDKEETIDTTVEVVTEPEIEITPPEVVSTFEVSSYLDFTEPLVFEDSITISPITEGSISWEIRNDNEWLTFDRLTGSVAQDPVTIKAFIDWSFFNFAEQKESSMTIVANNTEYFITVDAINYSFSDGSSTLVTDKRFLTTYNMKEGELERQFLTVTNSGSGLMVYSFESDSDWLTMDSPASYIEGPGTIDIPVLIDWALIENNDLSKGIVTVTNNKSTVETVEFIVKAKSVPELHVTKNKLTQLSNGANANTFDICNKMARELDYAVTSDKNWLSFSSSTGSVTKGNDQGIEVFVDYTTFVEGVSQEANITINTLYGTHDIKLTATGYPSFKTSSKNITIKSLSNPTGIISITNTGSGVLDYSLSNNSSYLGLSSTHGSLNHGEIEEIEISCDFESIGVWDVYLKEMLELSTSAGNKEFSVEYMREVDPEQDPRLHVNRTSISIISGSNITESFTVTNTGTGIMNYNITAPSWIILNSSNGSLLSNKSNDITFSIDWDNVSLESTGVIEIKSDGVYDNYSKISIHIN